MKQAKNPPLLAFGEYCAANLEGKDNQLVGARSEFMKAVCRVIPAFLEQLRDRVYPEYARLAQGNPNYWWLGWSFEIWQGLSDPDSQLTPVLLAWARDFNVAKEEWILTGALETLSLWQHNPDWRTALDTSGFRLWIATPGLISYEEHVFQFEDQGWDPTLVRWADFRDHIQARFKRELDRYELRMRSLVESRGATRSRLRYSLNNFEWFALHQLAGLSHLEIADRYMTEKECPDVSSIRKGVQVAAKLLRWSCLRKVKK